MTSTRVSLRIEAGMLAEARERAGPRQLSAYVTTALRRQLQHDRVRDQAPEPEAQDDF